MVRNLIAQADFDEEFREILHDLAGIIRHARAMLNAMRSYDEFAFLDYLVPIAELYQQAPLVHQKECVLVLMEVPDEFAGELYELDLHIVNLTGNLWRPRVIEAPERVGQVFLVERLEVLIQCGHIMNDGR
jgi:hypothetical protein